MSCLRRSAFARSFLLPLALLISLSACHEYAKLDSPTQATLEHGDIDRHPSHLGGHGANSVV
jgi:hypothetical protein